MTEYLQPYLEGHLFNGLNISRVILVVVLTELFSQCAEEIVKIANTGNEAFFGSLEQFELGINVLNAVVEWRGRNENDLLAPTILMYYFISLGGFIAKKLRRLHKHIQ